MTVGTQYRFEADKHVPVFDGHGWRVAFADRAEPGATMQCSQCGQQTPPAAFLCPNPAQVAPLCMQCATNFVHSQWPHLHSVESKGGQHRGVCTHSQLKDVSWMKGGRYGED